MTKETFLAPGLKAEVWTADNNQFYKAYHMEGPLVLKVFKSGDLVYMDNFKTRREALDKMHEFAYKWASETERDLKEDIFDLKVDLHEQTLEVQKALAFHRAEAQYEKDKIHVQGLLISLALLAVAVVVPLL